MKVTAFNNNLFQLTRLGFVNCYLVREEDGLTLIDTGMSGQAQSIIQAAQQLGLPIVRIVLTHAHHFRLLLSKGIAYDSFACHRYVVLTLH